MLQLLSILLTLLISLSNPAMGVLSDTPHPSGAKANLGFGIAYTTSYQYDQAGRRTELRNPRNEAFTFAHGPDGQQDSLTYPSGRQRVVLERDERGLPRILRAPSGQLTTLGYDAIGRLTSHADNAGTITWTRDAEGIPTAVTEGSATITRTFDSLGRITSCTDTLGNTVGYGYDAEGNITTVTYPDGKTVTYTYDGAGRMTTVTDWADRTTTYLYDAAGRLDRVERPNGTVGIYEWDAANRLTGQREMLGPVTLWCSAYGYDAANRLQRLDQIPPAPQVPVPAAAMTFDADNQLATFNGQPVTGDADGNLLTAPLDDTTLGTFTWDARNRLTSATTSTGTTTTYGYDAENRRVTSTTTAGTTTYTWSRGMLDRLLVKTNPDGSITRYVHGLGLLYEEHEPAGGGEPIAQFYHFNWQGSTVALSDANGTITARIAYSPYGQHAVTEGTTDTAFLFNGQFGVMTEPHGLLTMMARFYSPTLCRFLSEDPVLFAGGDNFYAYAAGDPINLIDPFGLGPVGNYSYWAGITSGFAEGLGQGLDNFNNVVTFGLYDRMGWSQSAYNTGWQHDLSRSFAAVPRDVLLGAGAAKIFQTISRGTGAFVDSMTLRASLPRGNAVPTRGSDAFSTTMRRVDALDFSTPVNKAVFYSGPGQGARATAFAERTGGMTIEMTAGGRALAADKVFQSLSPAQQFQIWQRASTPFAQGASGGINAFIRGARPDRTFRTIEAPILNANPNVYRSTYHY
jgi:RHS repeat-associated protein